MGLIDWTKDGPKLNGKDFEIKRRDLTFEHLDKVDVSKEFEMLTTLRTVHYRPDPINHFKNMIAKMDSTLKVGEILELINGNLVLTDNDKKYLKDLLQIRVDYLIGEEIMGTKRTPYETFYVREKTPEIKKVIFNNPATIVIWSDNTKTIVKTQNGEPYDKEKGLAMAITKKFFGNEGNYYNIFTKWLKEDEEAKG